MKLRVGERKAILSGQTRALRREREPKIKAGEVVILAWSKGGKQIVERDEREQEKLLAAGKPLVVEVPRAPLCWIVLSKPRPKDDIWLVPFELHDHREPVRMLAPPPSPPRELGLKTRWKKEVKRDGSVVDKRVPERGERIETFTSETERGYGGRASVDPLEAVQDEYLAYDRAKRQVSETNSLLRDTQRAKRKSGRLSREYQERLERRQGRAA